MKNIDVIRAELKECREEILGEFIDTYSMDERAGVKKIVNQAKKSLMAYEAELDRVRRMREFEDEIAKAKYICGVDEVGRGPLAGPVVATAVILPKDCVIPYVNDSKKLNETKRKSVFHEIMKYAVSIGTGSVDNERIDEVNILQATFMAMREAIDNLTVKPDIILVDGNKEIPGIEIPQKAIVKGDSKSLSIASASIIAKVLRDEQMKDYAKVYPMYDFESNKGYNSEKHRLGLESYGLSPIHRKTFVH